MKSQNSLDWKVPYTIRNFLRFKCLKWACMIHLNTYNTSYGPKKGQKSKCQFDSWPLKVRNCLELHAYRGHATYLGKFLTRVITFFLNHTSIGGRHKKLWAFKMARVSILGISRFFTWESWKKWHLDATSMANHKEYYKGEGGGFPQVRVVVNFMSPCMLMVHPCTKNAPTMH